MKQDCEWKASLRWLERLAPCCAQYNPIYRGDDLYVKQEICAKILGAGGNFIFTCKDGSHKTLCQFRNGIIPESHHEIKGRGNQKKMHYTDSVIPALPIRDGKDALLVNWFEVSISKPDGKQTYHASFITNLLPTVENIAELASCARARWKIENETFNVLKNNGYHLEHNFGHGKKTLASLLAAMNLLAFSLHDATGLEESPWQEARAICGARNRLFSVMSSLTACIVFPGWSSLMRMITTGRPPPAL